MILKWLGMAVVIVLSSSTIMGTYNVIQSRDSRLDPDQEESRSEMDRSQISSKTMAPTPKKHDAPSEITMSEAQRVIVGKLHPKSQIKKLQREIRDGRVVYVADVAGRDMGGKLVLDAQKRSLVGIEWRV
ncbi:hypothetical protein [Marininema mesophilum]|nr:hypothetical protein [Marininema mesophilum]